MKVGYLEGINVVKARELQVEAVGQPCAYLDFLGYSAPGTGDVIGVCSNYMVLGLSGEANLGLLRNGNVGMGDQSLDPGRLLDLGRAGSPQLRLSESSSNYWELWGGNSLHFDKGAGTYPFTLSAAGNLGIGTGINPTSFRLEVNGSAAKPGGGSWSASSDRRLKQDIRPYTEGLAAVLSIKPVRFRYNERSGYDTKPEYIGVIAQELQASAPYMVSSVPRTQADGTETPYLAVDNSAMTYMLVNAVKEQQATIERQEAEIKALRSQMDSLLSEFAALKAGLNK
ncbi:MAG: tail fiber domain-containing protein [Saprospirales bacterium]|nr:tail fiber domain-containing protein [Saprospirales bacterium]